MWLAGGQPWRNAKSLFFALVRRDGRRCSKCGQETWLDHKIPLEVNHKDGNSENNTSENLELLCSNCHAITPNFKAKNKGNGRQKRRERERSIHG